MPHNFLEHHRSSIGAAQRAIADLEEAVAIAESIGASVVPAELVSTGKFALSAADCMRSALYMRGLLAMLHQEVVLLKLRLADAVSMFGTAAHSRANFEADVEFKQDSGSDDAHDLPEEEEAEPADVAGRRSISPEVRQTCEGDHDGGAAESEPGANGDTEGAPGEEAAETADMAGGRRNFPNGHREEMSESRRNADVNMQEPIAKEAADPTHVGGRHTSSAPAGGTSEGGGDRGVDQWESLVTKALEDSGPRRQIVAEHPASGWTIRRSEFQTLNLRQWVSGEVLNMFCSLLEERTEAMPGTYARCLFFNIHFAPKLFETTGTAALSWRGYCLGPRGHANRTFDSYDLIFVPHHVGGVHLTLMMVRIRQQEFQYADSMRAHDEATLIALASYMTANQHNGNPGKVDYFQWRRERSSQMHQQTTPFDCGLYELACTEHCSRGAPGKPRIGPGHAQFRRMVARALLQGEQLPAVTTSVLGTMDAGHGFPFLALDTYGAKEACCQFADAQWNHVALWHAPVGGAGVLQATLMCGLHLYVCISLVHDTWPTEHSRAREGDLQGGAATSEPRANRGMEDLPGEEPQTCGRARGQQTTGEKVGVSDTEPHAVGQRRSVERV